MDKKFLISGGGTGGHIYPAIAIADEIKERFLPKIDFFGCDKKNTNIDIIINLIKEERYSYQVGIVNIRILLN